MPFDTMQTAGGGIINNPLGSLIDGIVQGANLHAMIQREQDNHIAMQRQEVEGQRNMRLKDIQERMDLETKGRPIENGMVQDILGSMPGVVGAEGQPYVRKADSKRRVSYKTVDGQSIDFELFTPMEQIQRAVKDKTALDRVGKIDASSILSSMQSDVKMPEGSVYVDPDKLPGMINSAEGVKRGREKFKVSPEMKADLGITEDSLPRDLYDNALNKQAEIKKGREAKAADDRRAREQRDFQHGEGELTRGNALQVALMRNRGGGDAGGLSEAALDQAADAVKSGAKISEVTRGQGKNATATATRIMNRVAEKYPDFKLASAQSDLKADSGSLNTLQKSRDQVAAFENTAGKNLDQFLATAKKVVDSGSPLINQPIRGLALKLSGNPDQAAFNTARQVAVTEIAKVLSNPGLSGQLSDSARHEVQDLIGPNATLAQIYSAAKILKADMKNRGDSMDSEIKAIKGRISGTQGEALKATHRFNPETGMIEAVK
jgi:hypothetical protein